MLRLTKTTVVLVIITLCLVCIAYSRTLPIQSVYASEGQSNSQSFSLPFNLDVFLSAANSAWSSLTNTLGDFFVGSGVVGNSQEDLISLPTHTVTTTTVSTTTPQQPVSL